MWDGYADGWGIRTMTTASLEAGATRNYLVTFYPNKEYQTTTAQPVTKAMIAGR